MKLLLSVTGMGDRVVEAGREATVAELAAAFDSAVPGRSWRAPAAGMVRTLRVDRNGAILAPDCSISELDLRSGDRVAVVELESDAEFDRGPETGAKPSAVLRMLTGPLAGEIFELSAGASTVGRTADNDLVLKDPGISRRHATITVDASAVVVIDLGSTNGIRIEGRPIDGPTALRSGQRLLLGQSWVAVDHHGAPVVPVEGRIDVDRPQRQTTTYQGQRFQVPKPPDVDDGASRRGPLGSRMQSRQHDRAYTGVIDQVVADINIARREEREARLAESPSVDDVVLGVRSRTRLWERRLTDPDVLRVRVGLAELASRHRIDVEPGGSPSLRLRVDRLPQTYSMIDGVPATLDLGRPGGLRVRGGLDRVRPIAAAMVAQLVGLNPPDQLGVIHLGEAVSPWDWLKWIPHLDRVDGEAPTGERARARLTELLAADPVAGPDECDRSPFIVVVVDGAEPDDGLVARLQSEGPSRGVHPLIIEGPIETEGGVEPLFGVGAVLAVGGPTARLSVPGDPIASVDPIAVERLEADTAIEFGRLLAPLSMRRIEAIGGGMERASAPAPVEAAAAADDRLSVEPLALGPAPTPVADPLAPPDLFDLPRSVDDVRLVLGQVRMADETETILAFSPPRDGTLALIGSSPAELTGCLLTVAASAARFDGSPHTRPVVYAIGDGLRRTGLGSLPVVAGVVGDEATEVVDCLAELEQLMADRLLTFELAGVDDVDGFRRARPGIALRRALVVIDGLGRLTERVEPSNPGRVRQVVGQLLEIGSALGLHLVMTVEDRSEVDPLLAPKVGRWLELAGDDGRPGRVQLDGVDVRFAAAGGSWALAGSEQTMARLAAEVGMASNPDSAPADS